MLHDILDDDHIQWYPTLIGHYTNFWPLLIWTILPNMTFYLIAQGFHWTYATGAACQQRTFTPPDTWSCPTLGLEFVLMSRVISPELVVSADFWISNKPRYFSFALNWILITFKVEIVVLMPCVLQCLITLHYFRLGWKCVSFAWMMTLGMHFLLILLNNPTLPKSANIDHY